MTTARNHDLVAQYTRLAAASGDAWHIANALEHSQCLDDGVYYADATIEAIRQVRPIAAEAMQLSAFPHSDPEELPSWSAFTAAARRAHGLNYAERGDRYAEPEEMADHLSDPLGMYELVRDRLILSHGVAIRSYGVLDWADAREIEAAVLAVTV